MSMRCSALASLRNDSMVATAPPAQHWLLIEQEGPWPLHALDALPGAVSRSLTTRAAAVGARISLIRRTGRHPRRSGSIRWAYADVRRGREGIRWQSAQSAADIAQARWEVEPGEGEAVAIVCAHSRHDVCCALNGRPVTAALASRWPGRVWECSHLGGDRFAATMVLLPHGLCYGRLTPDNATPVLTAYERGSIVPELLRGRCSDDRLGQAAQALVRSKQGGFSGIADLPPVRIRTSGELCEVVLDGETPVTVRLLQRTVALGSPATCRSTVDAQGREYDLVSITRD